MSAEPARLSGAAGPSCRYEFVSTEQFEPAERFAAWRDCYLTRCEPFGAVDAKTEKFSASYQYLVVPEGEFIDLRMTSTGLARPPRPCRAIGSTTLP